MAHRSANVWIVSPSAPATTTLRADLFTHQTAIPRSPAVSALTLALHMGLWLVLAFVIGAPRPPAVRNADRLRFTPVLVVPAPLVPDAPKDPIDVPLEPAVESPAPAEYVQVVGSIPAFVEPVRDWPSPRPTSSRGPEAAAPVREAPPTVAPLGVESVAAAAPATLAPVGGFEERVELRTSIPAATTAVGFSTGPLGASPALSASRTPGLTSGVGFGVEPTKAGAAPVPQAVLGEAGFGAGVPAPPPVTPPAPGSVDQPLAILSKPTPAYTFEARAQRIEGDVTLDVEFGADGQVRVRRVVNDLGFGLGDMAKQAAERIKFAPAKSRGRPVDVRTRVTIVFRLA